MNAHRIRGRRVAGQVLVLQVEGVHGAEEDDAPTGTVVAAQDDKAVTAILEIVSRYTGLNHGMH